MGYVVPAFPTVGPRGVDTVGPLTVHARVAAATGYAAARMADTRHDHARRSAPARHARDVERRGTELPGLVDDPTACEAADHLANGLEPPS